MVYTYSKVEDFDLIIGLHERKLAISNKRQEEIEVFNAFIQQSNRK